MASQRKWALQKASENNELCLHRPLKVGQIFKGLASVIQRFRSLRRHWIVRVCTCVCINYTAVERDHVYMVYMQNFRAGVVMIRPLV